MPVKALGHIHPENAELVAVEGQRLTKGCNVGVHGRKVAEGRLGPDKLQMHQPGSSIIDEYQQRALRRSPFKPIVW